MSERPISGQTAGVRARPREVVMHHATQVALTRRVFDFVERRTTELADSVYLNPVAGYTSPEQAALEQQLLFREHPLFFGPSGRVPHPGDYVADDLSGIPIAVTRTEAGQVRAFLNVCRHRGAKVVQGVGSGKRAFVCPYHAWTYDLEGRLKSLPREGFSDLTCEERSLVPLPVVEKYGLIWVRLRPGPAFDPDELLGGLGSELDSYRFGGYAHYATTVLRKQMNWKLVVDTFLETWHVPTLHRATIAPTFQPNVNVFDAFGRNGRLIIPRRSLLTLKDQPESEWNFLKHTAIVYSLFPNTLLVWQGDHLETWRSFPVAGKTDECVTEGTLFTPTPATTDEAKRYWDRNWSILLETVDAEDFPTGEGIQRGFGAGAQTHTTFGRNEPGLSHYHRSIRQALGLERDVRAEPLTRAVCGRTR